MKSDYIFTSGSVTDGHPDKLCDVISDAIIDRYLTQDPAAVVVAECAASSGVIFLATRIATEVNIDMAGVVRDIVAEVGYLDGDFNARDCSVMLSQAPSSAYALPRYELQHLDRESAGKIPASHQSTLFGYACRQTENLMPLPVALANQLTKRLSEMRREGGLAYLTPDCQVQVAIAYRKWKPIGIDAINFLATQKIQDAPTQECLRQDLIQMVVDPVLSSIDLKFDYTRLVVNPGGALVGGGPVAHSGMTGRKTGIDSYGEYARQSGAALSGKDPLRIDRIGAYAARYVAKHIVAASLAEECEIQLSYSVGQPKPVSLRIHTYGTGTVEDEVIAKRVRRVFDLRPGIIAQEMGLQQLPAERRHFYQDLATYGHMGREDLDAPWERLDKLDELRME